MPSILQWWLSRLSRLKAGMPWSRSEWSATYVQNRVAQVQCSGDLAAVSACRLLLVRVCMGRLHGDGEHGCS